MITIRIHLLKAYLRIMFEYLLNLCLQILPHSFVDDPTAIFRRNHNMVSGIIDAMTLLVIFHAPIISKKILEASSSHGLTPGGLWRWTKI
jgi:hypothetical protein